MESGDGRHETEGSCFGILLLRLAVGSHVEGGGDWGRGWVGSMRACLGAIMAGVYTPVPPRFGLMQQLKLDANPIVGGRLWHRHRLGF